MLAPLGVDLGSLYQQVGLHGPHAGRQGIEPACQRVPAARIEEGVRGALDDADHGFILVQGQVAAYSSLPFAPSGIGCRRPAGQLPKTRLVASSQVGLQKVTEEVVVAQAVDIALKVDHEQVARAQFFDGTGCPIDLQHVGA